LNADLDQPFHYVVAGAGTAGCVLAARLSEDPDVRVALIEAGPQDRHWAIAIPTAVAKAIHTPALNWNYKSVDQPHLGGRPVMIPRGRVVGGSSSINGMAYFRGHPGDFDDWAALGNEGWGYADLLPYFTRSESNPEFAGSPYHGVDGPMRVIHPQRPNRLIADFLHATGRLQHRANDDFNGPDPAGFGTRQATIRDGRRESMATAFLRPAAKRANLTIVTGAMIDRVRVEEGRATALEVIVGGERRSILARREVVLTAGAYGSPAILLRSGIGDRAALRDLGIAGVHHLAGVGRGLRDHPSAAIQMKTRDHTSYGVSVRSLPRNIAQAVEYMLFRTGPVAGNVFEATGFVKSRPDVARPDLQLVFMPAHRNRKPYPLPFGHGYGILSIAVRPKSEGSVSLASADPHDAPLIDFNFYADPDDLRVVRDGLKLARRILTDPVWQRYRAHEIIPGPAAADDAALDEHIRRTTVTVHHPGCTARMGRDDMAVVDPSLRVRGIDGLRVADASIYPTLVAGNTNASVVMIAEKAADLIRGRAAPAPIELPHAA